jgi:diguanylate cyclase (GGDEF)-like protein
MRELLRAVGRDRDAASGEDSALIRATSVLRAGRRRQRVIERHVHPGDDHPGASHERDGSARDALTGARLRASGLDEFEHELQRCRHAGGRLVVTYVDVVGLKSVNESDGYGAGDVMLEHAVTHIIARLGPGALVIRLCGAEFLCAMSDTTLADARERFDEIAATLAADVNASAIETGFAELQSADSAAQLVARAHREQTSRSEAVQYITGAILRSVEEVLGGAAPSAYAGVIRRLAPGEDPALVEAFVRLEHGPLSNVEPVDFAREVAAAVTRIHALDERR